MGDVNRHILFLIFSLLLFASCSTKRAAMGDASVAPLVEIVSSSPAVATERTMLSGGVKLSANIAGKEVSGRGTVRIKENEGVQIGITALGLVEVACIEFLPDTLCFIYKIGKEYASLPYTSVPFLARTGLSYQVLESVLMNRVFTADGKSGTQALETMSFADEGEFVTATTDKENAVVYKFFIEKSTSNLVRCEGVYNSTAKVVCTYSEFEEIGGAAFPHIIDLSLETTGAPATLQFKLSNLDFDSFEFRRRRIGSSYDRIDIDEILRSLSGF